MNFKEYANMINPSNHEVQDSIVSRRGLAAIVVVCLTIIMVAGVAAYYGIETAKIAHEEKIEIFIKMQDKLDCN